MSEETEEKKAIKEAVIRCSDMNPQQECEIIGLANCALVETGGLSNLYDTQKYSKAAATLKKGLDSSLGGNWHAVCGKNFGSFVTHEQGTFLHFSFDDIHFAVFRVL